MKAADLRDSDVLLAVWELGGKDPGEFAKAFTWDIAKRFPGVPEKVVVAKLKALKRRGLVDGCTCGCRGDFTLVDLRGRI